ncbi:MAG: hypothetical protein JWP20_2867 [Roseomonas sp.]|jgi:hypothetical protein|nr:hypothetical protein [Roseomonas sp.]
MTTVSTGKSWTGLAHDPRILAGAAAGLVSALAALWAFRGLPLGTVLFWFSPAPLFLAGLGFGLPAFLIALAVAGVTLLVSAQTIAPVAIYLGAYGIPAALLLATALRGATGHLALSMPLALLGLWPACLVLLAGLLLAGPEGGLEVALRDAVTLGLTRMGLDAPAELVEQIVRLKASALALWLALALAANAAFAQKVLRRNGLDPAPATRWSTARLPRWYPGLPALAGLVWLLADPVDDLLPLSVALTLAVPLLLQGLAALHTRLPRAKWRGPILVLIYVLLLVFSLPGAIILVALGLVEQFGRATPPSANS